LLETKENYKTNRAVLVFSAGYFRVRNFRGHKLFFIKNFHPQKVFNIVQLLNLQRLLYRLLLCKC